MITVVDYGAYHAQAVAQALKRLTSDETVTVSTDPEVILQSDGVIVPGGGVCAVAMRGIQRNGLRDVLWQTSLRGVPLLGIGLGMHVLFSESEEHGLHRGLNLLPGCVEKLPVPHVGWNALAIAQAHPLLAGLAGQIVYFSHTYGATVANYDETLAIADDGGIVAAVGRHPVYGVQFHPEKSGAAGKRLLENFVSMCRKERK